MKLEIRRQIFHLVLGNILAILVIILQKWAVVLFGLCLAFGLVISEMARRKIKLPFFSFFLNVFERKNVFPGKGTITFFLGGFIALVFFEPFIVFLSILVLAYCDSFSTMFGKAFGREKIWKRKTFEGTFAGFAAGFFICLFYISAITAFIVAAVAAILELFTPIDDNLIIPPIASVLLYIMR
jgi:dolichol kinase